MNNHSIFHRFRNPLVLLAALTMVLTLAACGGSDGDATTATAEGSGVASTMKQMDGRGVSATDQELVLSTPGGEWTFKIRPEDVAAVDPEHVNSHADVPEIGFRVFYVTEDGVDYVVSVEEIDASSLGF